MLPCVSIIIPSYNHQDYVLEAINSVLQQDWGNIDLIVIDDGSTDNSPSLINELHLKHGGFRFISRDNQGLVHTLEEGLRLAEGKYFCELASDDMLPPDSIKKRVLYLEENPTNIAVYTDGFFIKNDNLTDKKIVNQARFDMFQNPDPIPSMLKGKGPIFSTGLFNTKKLKEIGGFNARNFHYYEDLDMPIRIRLAGKTGYIHEPIFYKRQHDTNVSYSTSHVRAEKVINYKNLLTHPLMAPYINELRNAYINSQISLAKYILKCKKPKKEELQLLSSAWPHALHNPKLILYLLITYIRHPINNY